MKARNLLLVLSVALVLTCGGAFAAEKEWTVCVFANADNNLDNAGVDDLNEMERVGSTDEVNILCMLDRWNADGTNTFYVEKDDSESVTSPIVHEQDEVDMGDWQQAQGQERSGNEGDFIRRH